MSDFDEEAMFQVYGRLTAHEFLLEILYSQFLAGTSGENASKFADDIAGLMKRSWLSADVDQRAPTEKALLMMQDAHTFASMFLRKALERAETVRKARQA